MRTARYLLDSLIHTPAEVLVVLLIAALLLGIAGPGMLQLRERAREHQKEDQLKSMGMAVASYHETYQSYPVSPPKKKRSKVQKNTPPKDLISPLVVLPFGIR